MHYSLSLHHLTLSDNDEQEVKKKLDRLHKHLHAPFTTHVRLEHSTHHLKGDVVTCIVNIAQDGQVYHAERTATSVADAIDEVVEALNKELGRAHDKRKDHHN